jgi:hypothetical protein
MGLSPQLLPKEHHAEDPLTERVSSLHTKEISTGKWTYDMQKILQTACVTELEHS